ncbi:hypothetical protein ACJIZ3_000169 [Penstemon smallii]|uniref:Uncharacterized protein n=1 Tax=Penstemon smallii TaxID=265156 RepID=A0ABD3R8E9_9LAMI
MFSLMKASQTNKMTIYAQKYISTQNTSGNEVYNIPTNMPIPIEPFNNYAMQENMRLNEIRRQMIERP